MVFKTLLQESCIRKSEFALRHSSSRRRRRHATCSVGPGTFNCKLHVLNLLLRPTKDKTKIHNGGWNRSQSSKVEIFEPWPFGHSEIEKTEESGRG